MICFENQLTSFYMMSIVVVNGFNCHRSVQDSQRKIGNKKVIAIFQRSIKFFSGKTVQYIPVFQFKIFLLLIICHTNFFQIKIDEILCLMLHCCSY